MCQATKSAGKDALAAEAKGSEQAVPVCGLLQTGHRPWSCPLAGPGTAIAGLPLTSEPAHWPAQELCALRRTSCGMFDWLESSSRAAICQPALGRGRQRSRQTTGGMLGEHAVCPGKSCMPVRPADQVWASVSSCSRTELLPCPRLRCKHCCSCHAPPDLALMMLLCPDPNTACTSSTTT